MGTNRLLLGCSLTLGLLAAGCGDSDPEPAAANDTPNNNSNTQSQNGQPLADFRLLDTNATSARGGQEVSPREYLQKVTGWYFTHAS